MGGSLTGYCKLQKNLDLPVALAILYWDSSQALHQRNCGIAYATMIAINDRLVSPASIRSLIVKFLHTDLGYRKHGEIVEVTLSGNAANVLLLDSSNFLAYKNRRRYTYYGGLAKISPVRLPIPSNGHWHIAVDTQGLSGNTRVSVRVLS